MTRSAPRASALDHAADRAPRHSVQRLVRHSSLLQKYKLVFLWEFPKSCEVLIRTLLKLLIGLVSTVPSRVQVMVKMAHRNLKFRGAVLLAAGKTLDRLVQLLTSLAKMEEDNASIHNLVERKR